MAEHASQAVLGWGTHVLYGNGDSPETFSEVHDLVTASPPDEQTEDVEVSHCESPGKTKEYIQGWIDSGAPTLELNWNPSEWPDHKQMVLDKASGQKRNWMIVLPGAIETITFPAYVKGIARTIDPKGAIKATITLKSDAVTSASPEIT